MRSDFEKVLSIVDLSLKAIWSAFLLFSFRFRKKSISPTSRIFFSLFFGVNVVLKEKHYYYYSYLFNKQQNIETIKRSDPAILQDSSP